MKKAIVIAALMLTGCASNGPAFRGEPPAGFTHRQYANYLTGTGEYAKNYHLVIAAHRERAGAADHQ